MEARLLAMDEEIDKIDLLHDDINMSPVEEDMIMESNEEIIESIPAMTVETHFDTKEQDLQEKERKIEELREKLAKYENADNKKVFDQLR